MIITCPNPECDILVDVVFAGINEEAECPECHKIIIASFDADWSSERGFFDKSTYKIKEADA